MSTAALMLYMGLDHCMQSAVTLRQSACGFLANCTPPCLLGHDEAFMKHATHRACSFERTTFSSFCVMRKQRVRLLAALCHSSLRVLSSTKPRSLAAAAARRLMSASTSSFSSRRACGRVRGGA